MVAEANRDSVVLDQAEHQLKMYMLQMGCAVGLIITPSRLRIYKDRFLGPSEESIERVGDFPARELLGSAGKAETDSLLESELLQWLEQLAHTGQASVLDPSLKAATSEYILPAVSGGVVSFAHPAS